MVVSSGRWFVSSHDKLPLRRLRYPKWQGDDVRSDSEEEVGILEDSSKKNHIKWENVKMRRASMDGEHPKDCYCVFCDLDRKEQEVIRKDPAEYIEWLGEVSKWYRSAPKSDYGWWVGSIVLFADDVPCGMFDYDDDIAVYREVPESHPESVRLRMRQEVQKIRDNYEAGSPEDNALWKAWVRLGEISI